MKKIFIIALLISSITLSLLAGTLSNYTTSIDNLASGSVMAKEFIFLKDGQDTFSQGVKIAPTETVIWEFGVRNYDGGIITETDLYYELVFHVMPTPGKSAIEPLIVTVKDESGNAVGSVTGVGDLTVTGEFPLSAVGQKAGYTVEIYWPSNDLIDIDYAGESYSTTINVSALASQIKIGDGGSGSDGSGGSDGGDQSPLYYSNVSTSVTHDSGSYYFFDITNNGDADIKDGWVLELDAELSDFFSLMKGSHLMPSGTWAGLKTVDTAGDEKPELLLPVQSSSNSDHFTIPAGQTLRIRVQLSGTPSATSYSVDSAKLRIPYLMDGISVSFSGYSMWGNKKCDISMNITNASAESFIYGWSVEFKTNGVISSVAPPEQYELLGTEGGLNTYRIWLTSVTNAGDTYFDANETKSIYIVFSGLLDGDGLTVSDITFNGTPISGSFAG